MISEYVKGYAEDAGVDIIVSEQLTIVPGFQIISLPVCYTPSHGEVAFILSRGSTLRKGIFTCMWAIDTGYTGTLSVAVYNASDKVQVFEPGDRAFSIVNLALGTDRVGYDVVRTVSRNNNKFGSSGGVR